MDYVVKKTEKYDLDTKKQLISKFANMISDYKNGKIKSKFFDYRNEIANCTFKHENLNDIIEQLTLDKILYDKGDNVSECAYFAPRNVGKSKFKLDIVEEIIQSLFPFEKDDKKMKTYGYIQYQQLLSQLTNKFIDQELSKQMNEQSYKMIRLAEYRDLWEKLKNADLSEQILNPSAMPVEIAPKEDLESFFHFLESNMDIEKENATDYEWLDEESCIRFTRGAVYSDGRMDLCKQVVGPSWINDLMDSLKFNDKIKHFLLGNNIIGPVGGLAIKNFLLNEHVPKIKTWYLAGNDLNEEGIKYLVDGLENDTDCDELWLKRNPIKVDGMKHIQRLLEKNKSITTLDLNNVATLDEGCKYLFEGLKSNSTLKILYLDANGITNIGIKYMVDYFEYLIKHDKVGITSLWIGMNRIYDDGAIELVNTLKNYHYLERLCLSSNALTEKSMPYIYEAFRNHPSIFMLDFGMYKSTADMRELTNKLGDESIDYIIKLLNENLNLKYLSILHNDISDDGIKRIVDSDSFENHKNLLFFDYKQYFTPMPKDIRNKITDILSRNRDLNGVKENDLRYIKHTKEIVKIDSIYRNSDK
jgi:Ran GTPase-activating protein (RanGAP) involved in mRNA processing and transport